MLSNVPDVASLLPRQTDRRGRSADITLQLPAPTQSLQRCPEGRCRSTSMPVRPILRWSPTLEVRYGHPALRRWVVGHHLAFGAWRLLIDGLAGPAATPSAAGEQVAMLFPVYTAAMVYSGSCTLEEYRDVVRPSMAAHDPAFSGRWAREYEYVNHLIHERPTEVRAHRDAGTAIKLNHVAHRLIGRRLVPDAPSLFAAAAAQRATTDAQRDSFDAYFLVRRAPVCRSAFVSAQLARLVLAVAELRHLELDPVLESYVPGGVSTVFTDHARHLAQLRCDSALPSDALHPYSPVDQEVPA